MTDRRSDGRTVGQTESIIAKTALCIASYADALSITRKLSYRKDDRAMRLIYGCPENFRESLAMPMAIFPKIFNELSP